MGVAQSPPPRRLPSESTHVLLRQSSSHGVFGVSNKKRRIRYTGGSVQRCCINLPFVAVMVENDNIRIKYTPLSRV